MYASHRILSKLTSKLVLMRKKTLVAILLTLSATAIVLLLAINLTSIFIPDLSTVGYVKVHSNVEVEGERGVLTLKNNCKELRMSIIPWQARSIEVGMKGVKGIRPNSHDLLASILEDYGIEVLMVKVTHLKDGTYYAKLIVRKGNKILGLDSRPSDAVALAVRVGADVFVNDGLMKNVC